MAGLCLNDGHIDAIGLLAVAPVLTAKHLGSEAPPLLMARGGFTPHREGMVGGTDSHKWLAGGQVAANEAELIGRQATPPKKDDEQVGRVDGLQPRKPQPFERTFALDDDALVPATLAKRVRKLGNRPVGLVVLRLGIGQKDDLRRLLVGGHRAGLSEAHDQPAGHGEDREGARAPANRCGEHRPGIDFRASSHRNPFRFYTGGGSHAPASRMKRLTRRRFAD